MFIECMMGQCQPRETTCGVVQPAPKQRQWIWREDTPPTHPCHAMLKNEMRMLFLRFEGGFV